MALLETLNQLLGITALDVKRNQADVFKSMGGVEPIGDEELTNASKKNKRRRLKKKDKVEHEKQEKIKTNDQKSGFQKLLDKLLATVGIESDIRP